MPYRDKPDRERTAASAGLSFGNPMDEEPPQIEANPGTELIIEVEGVYGHLKSELVGKRPGHYLIIRTPAGPPGFSSKLFKGNTIIVRYLEKGSACGFQSHIISTVTEPESLTFIECPRLVQEKSLRDARRLETYLPCKVAVNSQTTEGNIVDLSRTGCRCVLPVHLHESVLRVHVGDALVIALPLDDQPVRVTGKVRNVNTCHASLQVGIQFEGLDKETDEHIVEFLVKHGAEI
jgi:c-di-GMP-binding flagellar brake protein YcgR